MGHTTYNSLHSQKLYLNTMVSFEGFSNISPIQHVLNHRMVWVERNLKYHLPPPMGWDTSC